MYNKLRRRFMLVSTLVLLFVICLVVGIAYWFTSNTIMSQARFIMKAIVENNGSIPEQEDFNPTQDPFLALNQESIYEVRFLTAVVTDGETSVKSVNMAMKDSEIQEVLAQAYNSNSNSGRLTLAGNRRINYLKQTKDTGSTFIVLLDTTSRYSLIHMVILYLAGLWLVVIVLYVIIMGRYSKKLLRPFVENDERQKRFITNASHELKTPLAVISSNTEMTEALGGANKWTESTRRQVGKLQTLIEDLVVLSRLDEMQELALTRINLSETTTDTTEGFRNIIEDSGKTLNTNILPDMYAKSEQRSFQQLVSILMDNAVKYCDDSGIISVALEPRTRGKGVSLTVSNTYAEGKDVDYSRFFERFYREDESHNSNKAGFGIGLSMAREIAERLGGKLKVSYAGDTISFHMDMPH